MTALLFVVNRPYLVGIVPVRVGEEELGVDTNGDTFFFFKSKAEKEKEGERRRIRVSLLCLAKSDVLR